MASLWIENGGRRHRREDLPTIVADGTQLHFRPYRAFDDVRAVYPGLRPGLSQFDLTGLSSFRRRRFPMPYVMVDIESDGPIPGDYSMICFGAIIVEPALDRTFYGRLQPISERFIPEALAVSGFSREECLGFDDPRLVMEEFAAWVKENCRAGVVRLGQQRVRLAVHQLVLSPLHGRKSVRVQLDQSRLALQRAAAGRLRQLQASAADQAYAPSGRRRSRECGGSAGDEGVGAED